MRKLFYVLNICFFSLQCFSQMEIPKPEEAEILKSIPLFVELKTKNEKIIEQLSKKDKSQELEKYISDIESYNIVVKKAFEKTWIFSKEVKFITDTELEVMKKNKAKNSKYAIFRKEINGGKGPNSLSMMNYSSAYDQTYFNISILGNGVVMSLLYNDGISDASDIIFVIQQFQNSLTLAISINEGKTKKQIKEEFKLNALKIKDKILLVNQTELEKSLIDKFKDTYPYKYKITTKEEINEAIANNNSNIVYLKILPFKHVSNGTGAMKNTTILYAQYIVNAENGQLLYLDEPRGFAAMGSGVFGKLGKFDLKSIVKAIEIK